MILWAYVFSGCIVLLLSLAQYWATDNRYGKEMISFSIGWISALVWSGVDLI